MLAEAQALSDQFEHVNKETFKWAEGLTDDQLNWKPAGKNVNSIGNLISHILGVEVFWVVERVGGQAVNRDRTAEFDDRASRAALMQRRAEVEQLLHATFDKLTPADLGRVVRTQRG